MRNPTLDWLKFIMAFMVVGLHGRFLSDISGDLSWLLENGLFRIAVPIFLIINGFFFAQNRRLRDWFIRVIVLYALWMTIYAPIWAFEADSPIKVALWVVLGWYHLWYLAGMIGAAALLVLLCKRFQTLGIFVVIIATFFIGVGIQYAALTDPISGTLGKAISWTPSHRNFLFFSFPFFALGYLIEKHKIADRVSMRAVAIVAFISLVALLFESRNALLISVGSNSLDNMAALFIVAPAVFICALKSDLGFRNAKLVSVLSNGVYFIHPMVLIGLGFSDKISPTPATLITCAISLALSWAITKISFLRVRLL